MENGSLNMSRLRNFHRKDLNSLEYVENGIRLMFHQSGSFEVMTKCIIPMCSIRFR